MAKDSIGDLLLKAIFSGWAKASARRSRSEEPRNAEGVAYDAKRDDVVGIRQRLAARRRAAAERHHAEVQGARDRYQIERQSILDLLSAEPLLRAAVRSFLYWEFDPGPSEGKFVREDPKPRGVGIVDLERGHRLQLTWDMRGECTSGTIVLAGGSGQSFDYVVSHEEGALVVSSGGLDLGERHAAEAARLLNANLEGWPFGSAAVSRIILQVTRPEYRRKQRRSRSIAERDRERDRIFYLRRFLPDVSSSAAS